MAPWSHKNVAANITPHRATDYGAIQHADARLWMLRCLQRSSTYRTNDALMQAFLRYIGMAMPRSTVIQHLHWMKEKKLVELHPLDDVAGLHVVIELTPLGAEVAQGIAKIDGVSRPLPD